MRLCLSWVVACALHELPVPERGMSAVDVETLQQSTGAARAASDAAMPAALGLFETVPGLVGSNESGAALLSRFLEELATTVEVVQNFQITPGTSYDPLIVDLAEIERNEYVPNMWENLFAADALQRCDCFEAQAQPTLYGFPEFKNGINENCCPNNATFDEAADRPIYTAVNTMRVDTGCVSYGDGTFVFKRPYALAAMVAPGDTGNWELCCVSGDQDFCDLRGINCSAPYPSYEQGTMANLTDIAHLVALSATYWTATDWVSTHAARLLEDDWGATPLDDVMLNTYFEAVLLNVPFFDEAVHFVVAGFSTLFGEDNYGARIRAWCVRHNKMLVWGRGTGTYNGRIVDVVVLDHLRSVVPSNVTARYAPTLSLVRDLWREARTMRESALWDTVWPTYYDRLVNVSQAQIQPMSLNACDDPNPCIGTTLPDRACLCYA